MGFTDRPVNLTTIANRLEISVSTVSRALRNVPGIHPATRSKVMEVAAELGYLPPAKDGGASGATRNVLCLSQVRGVSADVEYLSGISRAALALNLSVVSHHYPPEECAQVLQARTQPPALRDGKISGVLLMHRWPEPVVRDLAAQMPVVSIVHAYPEQAVDLIGLDDREGMLSVVRHLHERKHKRIGFFGYCTNMSWSRSRFSAYVEALMSVGRTFEQASVVEVSLEEALAENPLQPGESTASALRIAKERGVTAWVCPSMGLANNLIVAARAAGLKIGKDIAITGFHWSGRQPYGFPDVTSTRSDSEGLGATALRRLALRIEHPGEARRTILLPVEFHPGETA
jgi:DNA-binding LacI/PurR family transcriptional regulator